MTNESNHMQAQRGIEAAQVLENQAFKDAMAELRETTVAHWSSCSLADAEEQRLALMLMKVTDKFESLLIGRIEAGKFAQHLIDEEKARKESNQGFLRRALRSIA